MTLSLEMHYQIEISINMYDKKAGQIKKYS